MQLCQKKTNAVRIPPRQFEARRGAVTEVWAHVREAEGARLQLKRCLQGLRAEGRGTRPGRCWVHVRVGCKLQA